MEMESVRRCMSHPAVTIEESAPLAAALRIFLERRVRRLPVTRDGKLVGVIARTDVLKLMAQQWAITVGRATEEVPAGG